MYFVYSIFLSPFAASPLRQAYRSFPFVPIIRSLHLFAQSLGKYYSGDKALFYRSPPSSFPQFVYNWLYRQLNLFNVHNAALLLAFASAVSRYARAVIILTHLPFSAQRSSQSQKNAIKLSVTIKLSIFLSVLLLLLLSFSSFILCPSHPLSLSLFLAPSLSRSLYEQWKRSSHMSARAPIWSNRQYF